MRDNIDTSMKYFIYCRKSSEPDERQAISNESQREENKITATRYGITPSQLIDPPIEESHSAKIEGTRPKFKTMLEDINHGVANGIICWHPDRLSRNNGDMSSLINLLESGKLTEIVTNSQTFKNNPMDKFMFGFLCLQAKLENDKKGVDVKRGLNTKAEKGWLPSGAKPGYMNDFFAKKGNKTILIDPIRFPIIQKAWYALIYDGYSIMKILDKLNKEWGYRSPTKTHIGGKPMCRSQIYRIFRDPFYYGYFEYPTKSGKWHKGSHQSMITPEEFERAQVILGRKMAPRPTLGEFPFSGLMVCGECGARITAEEKYHTICSACGVKFTSTQNNICPECGTKTEDMENPVVRHYIYYHCTKRKKPNCTQGGIEVKDLEKQLDEILGQITISDRFVKWGIKYLNELNENEKTERNGIINNLHESYTACIRKIDNLTEMFISEGNKDRSLLSDDEFRERKQKLVEEKQNLENQMSSTGLRVENWLNQVEEKFVFATAVRERFSTGTPEEKRKIMFNVCSNLKLTNKKLDGVLDNLFEGIRNIVLIEPTVKPMFEPQNYVIKRDDFETKWSQNPSVLPVLESVRMSVCGI